ncbi:MAG: S1 family peptidase [Limisphaerales bacterium]
MLLLLIVIGCLSVEAATTSSSAGPTFFHDRLMRSKLASGGEKLINAGRFTIASELRTQLSRRNCRVTLTESRDAHLQLPELVRQRQPGVLIVSGLYKCDRCEKWHASGASGVALTKDGVFATCHHVIAATNRHAFFVMTAGGEVAPVVEVLAANEKADVAICRVTGIELNPVPLADVNPPVGSPISLISHPSGNHFTLTTGVISRYFFKPISKNRSMPAMSITAEFAKGSSGGPVFDAAGNVVGLAASTRSIYYHEAHGKQENFQMVARQCVPLSAIRELFVTDSD